MADPAAGNGRTSAGRGVARVAFATTRWTLVRSAGRAGTAESRQALEVLCGLYWYPLYAFVRQQGHGADDAGELTQEFFLRLLARNDFADADPNRGRFRSWLLGALKHFLADERDRSRAQKRGGGRRVGSINAPGDGRTIGPADLREAESRYASEPAHGVTPERVFDRRWALALLREVLAQLRAEMEGGGKGPTFEALKEFIGGGPDGRPYRAVADSLGTTEGAVKVAVHRLRRRYQELLRQQIAQTLEAPDEVEDEIRHLFAALRVAEP